jgi:hypothetical protein
MQIFSGRLKPPLFMALLLLCLFPPPAGAQTTERIDTGRFGAEEPPDTESSVQEETGFLNKWLYLGFRTGPSLRFYTPHGDTPHTGNDAYGLALDLALQAGVPVISFLSVQAEAVFTWDNASRWNFYRPSGGAQQDRYNQAYSSFSLQFPLTLRLNLYPGSFRLSPFFGLYLLAPLGNMENTNSLDPSDEFSSPYRYALPLGLVAGLGTAFKLGQGMFLADLRYAADLGEPETSGQRLYRRDMLSLTVGYEWGFFTKNRRNHE